MVTEDIKPGQVYVIKGGHHNRRKVIKSIDKGDNRVRWDNNGWDFLDTLLQNYDYIPDKPKLFKIWN